jgi:3-phenylpropionate/trans-cinnamate dioxygenase ferredoxin subunit
VPEYIQVCNSTDIQNGRMKSFSVRGREILIAKVENKIYAASGKCPHMSASLDKGALKGTIITCPRHASQFDLKDGHVVRWTNWSGIKLAVSKTVKSPRPLRIYAVKVEGDRVLVEI